MGVFRELRDNAFLSLSLILFWNPHLHIVFGLSCAVSFLVFFGILRYMRCLLLLSRTQIRESRATEQSRMRHEADVYRVFL